jgi:quercetin dioxygenase-like cupin family protein
MTRARGIGLRGLIAAGIWLAIFTAVGASEVETVGPVFQQNLPNIAGKTFTVVRVDFAPGARAEPHRHGQAFVFAYVLRGAVRSQLEGQPAQTFTVGQNWSEAPGIHHVLTENASAREPAQLLVVFVADSGASLKIDDR